MTESVHICCVFKPAFMYCAHPKAGQTTLFSRFQPFLLIVKPIDFTPEKNEQKWSKTDEKKLFDQRSGMCST